MSFSYSRLLWQQMFFHLHFLCSIHVCQTIGMRIKHCPWDQKHFSLFFVSQNPRNKNIFVWSAFFNVDSIEGFKSTLSSDFCCIILCFELWNRCLSSSALSYTFSQIVQLWFFGQKMSQTNLEIIFDSENNIKLAMIMKKNDLFKANDFVYLLLWNSLHHNLDALWDHLIIAGLVELFWDLSANDWTC